MPTPKKIVAFLFFFTCILLMQRIYAQETEKEYKERMEWWSNTKFGMFIHWGVYSVPAGIYKGEPIIIGSEWIMNRAKISFADYQQYARQFNPTKYDPEAWVKMARDAGMKYLIITAKHHDGFALFDSKASTWDVVDATPYGKDLIEPLAKACEKYGIRLGFYYSQAQDWGNSGGAAARRLVTVSQGPANPDSVRINEFTAANNGHWDPCQLTSSMDEYIDNVAIPQVKELLTNYGKVSVLWWDTPTDMTDEYAEKFQALLHLQPEIITNNRLKFPNFPGDFDTPEQKIPKEKPKEERLWETCMTMNDNWGYKSSDHNWKNTQELISNLCNVISKGGNFLLNVGPTSEGEFPPEAIQRLKEVGNWMKTNGESIYGAKPVEPYQETKIVFTEKDRTVYAIYLPEKNENNMPQIIPVQSMQPGKNSKVYLLGYKKPLEWENNGIGFFIKIPKEIQPKPPCQYAWVFKFEKSNYL
jgi:alpha-L-fucosidase